MLLALVDEPQMEFKIRGLVALRKFLIMCPPDLMRQTGLAEVFEDAVFPAVLSLPSLTPEDESLAILGAAYPVLFALAGIDDDLARELPPGMHTFTEAQQKLLDKIVREGILVGYHHASEHVRLVELFCDQLCCMVNGMGILTIKHLKVRVLPPCLAVVYASYASFAQNSKENTCCGNTQNAKNIPY